MKRFLQSPFNVLILLLFLIGTFLHFAPFLTYQRLVYSISEDGYYMLTIARNIAIGNGMSTANGTIPTNGTQPLVTFIMAGIFYLAGGDKILSIIIIVIMQWVVAVLISVLIYKTGIRLFKDHPDKKRISMLAAAIWYAGPMTMMHTINGLETGWYTLAVLYIVSLIVFRDEALNMRFSILIGFLLGIAFWIRNDAIFLISAMALVFLTPRLFPMSIGYVKRFAYVIMIGLTSFITASPWLIYNQFTFGRIMPISGYAQMFEVRYGGNFINLPRIITEYFEMLIPIPFGAQKYLPVWIFCVVFILTVIFIVRKYYQITDIYRKRAIMITGIFLIFLCIFYGTVFDSYYFLPRHLYPPTVFLVLGWSLAIFYGTEKLKAKIKQAPLLLGIIFLIIVSVISVIRLNQANFHMHFQEVDWVKNNLGDDVWVASFQSGALGYFHDRTINLDGKVNPEALRARQRNRMPDYMLDKKVKYLVDWVNLAEWLSYSKVSSNFEVLICDPVKNLTVLKRKDLIE